MISVFLIVGKWSYTHLYPRLSLSMLSTRGKWEVRIVLCRLQFHMPRCLFGSYRAKLVLIYGTSTPATVYGTVLRLLYPISVTIEHRMYVVTCVVHQLS